MKMAFLLFDLIVRSLRKLNGDSDQYLVRVILRHKISKVVKTKVEHQ